VTVPDLHAVEAYHAAVIAAIEAELPWHRVGLDPPVPARAIRARDRRMADRALARLRRHDWCRDRGPWPCLDSLDGWADLTDIGATYGVTP
jgi:hypothetical protein